MFPGNKLCHNSLTTKGGFKVTPLKVKLTEKFDDDAAQEEKCSTFLDLSLETKTTTTTAAATTTTTTNKSKILGLTSF